MLSPWDQDEVIRIVKQVVIYIVVPLNKMLKWFEVAVLVQMTSSTQQPY